MSSSSCADNYWHTMDDAERKRVLAALTYVSKALPTPPAPIVD